MVDPIAYAHGFASLKDEDIDPALAALAFVYDDHPGVSFERYVNHLKKISDRTREVYADLLSSGEKNSAACRLRALTQVFAHEFGYTGDQQSYDSLENGDLMRVIDRRKGLPIALSILCIHIARALDWAVEGLNMPGHFVCRLEWEGQRIIFDPFQDCKILQAFDLRELIKRVMGENAELSSAYFEPVTNRDVLIRLQNNTKLRQIDTEDYKAALRTVQKMQQIDAQEYRLLLDAGVLYARVDQPYDAISALEQYMKLAPYDRDRHDAALLLKQIRETTE